MLQPALVDGSLIAGLGAFIMSADLGTLNAVTLEGLWGRLRPIEPERDVARLYALQHDDEAETWKEMKVGPFADGAAFASHVEELLADPYRAFFAVCNEGDQALGWMCLMEFHPSHRTVELGYVLFTPPMRRTVLATEAFYLVIQHAFEGLGVNRLEWTCTATNLRSRRAADRLGFRFEGVLREKLVLKGKPADIAYSSMLAEDWPAQRETFRTWLSPGNFEAGVQLKPLRA